MRLASSCGILQGASNGGYIQREGGCAVIRQSHFIAVVGAFLIAVVVVGCAGVRSEAPQEDKQGQTEATETEARSPEATTEEARCEGTRTIKPAKHGGAVM